MPKSNLTKARTPALSSDAPAAGRGEARTPAGESTLRNLLGEREAGIELRHL